MAYKLVVWKKRGIHEGLALRWPLPNPEDEIPNLEDKTLARIKMYELYPYGCDGEVQDADGNVVDLLG